MVSILEQVIEKNRKEWEQRRQKKLNSLRIEYNEKARSTTSNDIDPVKNYSDKIFTDAEREALINELDYVNHNSTFDEKSFICNVENLFVSLVRHCIDRPHWKKRDTNERTLYKLTPQQVQYATKLKSISDRFKRSAILELKTHDKTSQNTLNILKTLAKDESIHITHPDEGKGVVILNKQ